MRWFAPGAIIVSLRLGPGRQVSDELEREVIAGLNTVLARHVQNRTLAAPTARDQEDDSHPGLRRHSFVFAGDGRATHWLLWLVVPEHQEGERERDYDAVKDIVDLLNENLAGRSLGSAGQIVAVMPNWLTTGTPPSQTIGGPGAPPRAITPAMLATLPHSGWPFHIRFPDTPHLQAVVDESRRGEDVTVLVLDTAPSMRRITAAAERLGNPLLSSLLDGRLTDVRVFPPLPDAQLWPVIGQRVAMTDHGLFVAGLIHDLAPRATIQLWRVLNDEGVGTLAGLLSALSAAFALSLPGPVILNLSLTITIPIEDLDTVWSAREGRPGARPATYRTRALFDRGLAVVFDQCLRHGHLIVAAAGNDSLGHAARLEPRYPARYDTVLAVTALAGNGRPAAYANQGDAPTAINGLATYGGDARATGGQIVITTMADTGAPNAPPDFPDAPISVVTSDHVPEPIGQPGANAVPNETGWAAWAGTSFATPIVTGAVVCLLSGAGSTSSMTADAVIDRMTTLATDTTPESLLAVNGIRATQF